MPLRNTHFFLYPEMQENKHYVMCQMQQSKTTMLKKCAEIVSVSLLYLPVVLTRG